MAHSALLHREDVGSLNGLWKNEGYAHSWVMGPVTAILTDLTRSMAEYPNIKPGQDFAGYQ